MYYYSHPCPYCGRLFYTYVEGDTYKAAEILHDRIVEHLHAYGEHDKEFDFDDGKEIDMLEVHEAMKASNSPPPHGYIVYEGAALPPEYNTAAAPSSATTETVVPSPSTSQSSNNTLAFILTFLCMLALLVFLLYPSIAPLLKGILK